MTTRRQRTASNRARMYAATLTLLSAPACFDGVGLDFSADVSSVTGTYWLASLGGTPPPVRVGPEDGLRLSNLSNLALMGFSYSPSPTYTLELVFCSDPQATNGCPTGAQVRATWSGSYSLEGPVLSLTPGTAQMSPAGPVPLGIASWTTDFFGSSIKVRFTTPEPEAQELEAVFVR